MIGIAEFLPKTVTDSPFLSCPNYSLKSLICQAKIEQMPEDIRATGTPKGVETDFTFGALLRFLSARPAP